MLISDLCDYCDPNIAVNGTIDIIVSSANDNNKSETSWISKVNSTNII